MKQINTFKDWWRAHSEEMFGRVKETDDWRAEFERCWEFAQSLELQRCVTLSAQQLSWEASIAEAAANGTLAEFLAYQKVSRERNTV